MRGVSWTRAFGFRASLAFHIALAFLVPRKTRAQCSNKPERDCDFFFEGYRGSTFRLTSGNDYTTTKIQHKNGTVGFATFSGAPCRTSGSTDNCKHLVVKSGARPPRKSTSTVTLKDRAQKTIKAVQGKCFQLYFGQVFVKPWNGQYIQLDWDSEQGTQFFPKAKRCVVVNVT